LGKSGAAGPMDEARIGSSWKKLWRETGALCHAPRESDSSNATLMFLKCLLRGSLRFAGGILAVLAMLWATGALVYDMPGPAWLHLPVALCWLMSALVAWFVFRARTPARIAVLLGFALILGWWLTLKPRSDRDWQPDVAQTAWADIHGDEITLHNIRRCEYRTVTDYTPHWDARTVRLSQITGIDFAITYWGSPYMAHPIASFQFADAPPICFSIETRKEVGEKYSAIGGFFRQYELIYIAAEESDVIRLRTNVRTGEDVYLYRLTITPEKARERFMEYVATLNQLRDKPRWYNAATTNCTTSIRSQHDTSQRAPWDWRMLVNGKGDEMMYERGAFFTGGLPFAALRTAARINGAARNAGPDADFSRVIREGRPGFPPTAVPAPKVPPGP
jgi:hypothetical protein